MSNIVAPTQAQLADLVAPYLKTQPTGLGFAIGYASPNFANSGSIYFAGNIQNQFGAPLSFNGDTPFEIASVSKTFTATLYALLLRSQSTSLTLGDFLYPNGPLQISSTLSGITLDSLMNYTSGLPEDNEDGSVDTPSYWPQPYYELGMLSYLNADPPTIANAGQYQYSNLGFAIMASILGATGGGSGVSGFEALAQNNIPAPIPASRPSQAGVFVLVNASGITDTQTNNGVEIACALANDLLLIMQGQTPPTDKSAYPRAALLRRRRPAQDRRP